MRLDGRFRHAKLVGDLLVEQTFRQHHQHPNLLRRQRHQAIAQPCHVGIGSGGEIDIVRNPDVSLHHLADGFAQRLDAEALGNEARCAKVHRTADGAGIVAGRDDDHGNRRKLRTQVDQSREAADSRHRKIEQDQINIGFAIEQRRQFLE